MDIILLHEGMYQVITVTKAMFEGAVRPEIVDCFSLCDILREKFTGDNKTFFGCVCN
tara:strand:+ start:780 stop:950 length:171 start_codon:yes stop_codon:yes gene_type:complete